jgi:hypothetical protein
MKIALFVLMDLVLGAPGGAAPGIGAGLAPGGNLQSHGF